MKAKFPNYSHAAKLGDLGVSIVSRIVSNQLQWLFARTHQEHDFGIDGRVELVTAEGHVTGQMFAIQIKCGMSFLAETNRWGYIYRGEPKHFNYLANYPLPVVICLCNPDTADCYWTLFSPEQTQGTPRGWQITVPFSPQFKDSKEKLKSIVPPARDALGELQDYWKFNKLVTESVVLLYILDENDVKAHETQLPRAFFDRLRTTKELAAHCQGRVEFSFSGYDDDPRELWEIPEVREYVQKLAEALPDLLFFARSEQPAFMLKLFALCHTTATWPDGRPTRVEPKRVMLETRPVAELVVRLCPVLNQLTEWIGMPREQEEAVFFSAARCMGIAPPSDEADQE